MYFELGHDITISNISWKTRQSFLRIQTIKNVHVKTHVNLKLDMESKNVFLEIYSCTTYFKQNVKPLKHIKIKIETVFFYK